MNSFYAFLSRMKYINRWGLMKSTRPENVAEHSQLTALIAHALAVIENKIYGKDINADRVGMLALFHESCEVLTGDLPTPIKYFSDDISKAYKRVEASAEAKLLSLLPDEIRPEIEPVVKTDKKSYEYALVKAADKLSAYIKCIEELKCLNSEFKSAHDTTKIVLDQMAQKIPSLKYFMDVFVGSFSKSLDEIM